MDTSTIRPEINLAVGDIGSKQDPSLITERSTTKTPVRYPDWVSRRGIGFAGSQNKTSRVDALEQPLGSFFLQHLLATDTEGKVKRSRLRRR